MLERDSTVTSVAALLQAALNGRGGALFIVGESGLGKTTVLDDARVAASASTSATVSVGLARGDVMEASLPYGLVAQAVLSAGGPDLFDPDPPVVGPVEARARRYRGVLRWLEEAGPVVLAIDDLQWGDPESLSLLSFLIRRLGGMPAAVIATVRPWPPDALEVCRSLVAAGCASIERLVPLSADAAARLLATRVPSSLPADVVDNAVALCGGNPLLLEQVADTLARGEILPPAGRLGAPDAVAFGDELVLARFAGVDADAVACARAGSVLGTSFQSELAIEIAGLDSRRGDAAMEGLCRSGVLRSAGGTKVEFVHPLFGHALYDDLPVPVRARLHAKAFSILTARGLRHEAAEAAVRGDLRGDERAVALLADIGREALHSGAPATAADRLGAAVRLTGDRVDSELLLDLAEALTACGRAGAVDVCERALVRHMEPTMRIRALRIAARALSLCGAHDAAAERFGQAVALAAAHDPPAAVTALVDQAMTAWFTAGPRHARAPADRARAIAEGVGGTSELQADATWGFVQLVRGDASGIERVAEAAEAVGAEPDSDLAELYSYWSRLSLYANSCSMIERLDEADRSFRALTVAATRVGAVTAAAGAACNHGYALLRMGRLEEAAVRLREGTDLWSMVSPLSSHFDAVGLALVLQLRGHLEESDAWRAYAESHAAASVGALEMFLLDIRGHRALREGNAVEASRAYLDLETLVERMGIGEPCFPPWGRHAVGAHVAAGRAGDARRVVDWLDAHAAALPCRYPRIAAATGRALIAELDGDREDAVAWHRAALELHADVDLPVEKVETLLEHGAFLRRTGSLRAARPVLADAAALAEAIGAHWLVTLAEAELRIAGGRRRRARDPHTLTPQERRVADLAAAGRTNRDIANTLHVSEATIETHLRHVYAKLGVGSRRQLMLHAKDPGFPGR